MITKNFIFQINNLLKYYKIENIDDVLFVDNLYKILIYPTDAFYLHREQFDAIINIIDNQDILFVTQLGYDGELADSKNSIHQIKFPFDYNQYRSIQLETISILCSSKFNWILVIDESIEGGEGVFAGTKDIVDKLKISYDRCLIDLINFVEFSIYDSQKRNVGYKHMLNLLNLLKQ